MTTIQPPHLLDDRGAIGGGVRIRGYLVDVTEVEAALQTAPGIDDAAVLVVERASEPAHLVAYVAPSRTDRAPSATAIRHFLRDQVPPWMVPSIVVMVGEIPRTDDGAVDVPALPPIPDRPPPSAPTTVTERRLAQVWSAVTGVDDVHRHDDVVALGADGLAMAELVSTISAEFAATVTVADLLERPTLVEQAELIDRTSSPIPAHPTAVPLRTTGTRPPLFCFAGAGSLGSVFLALARRLGDDQPVYAFHSHGLTTRGRPDWTVAAAARRHVRVLRLVQPHGPYLIAGHSLGGLVAMEVAEQLRAGGEEVALLVLVDTVLTGPPSGATEGAPERRTVSLRDRVSGAAAFVGATRATLHSMRRDTAFVWRNRMRAPLAGLLRLAPADQAQVFYEQGLAISWLHRPRRWPGRALVLLAYGNHDSRSDWAALVDGPLRIESIECEHMSILAEPFVAQVAAAITEDIDEALRPGRVADA
jgi:thioesterase domain-containing protein/aryl carrier-like protein